jgi:hypothetical protein
MRRGRKAADLLIEMAELPKDEPRVSSAFFFFEKKRGTLTELKLRQETRSEV